MKLLKLLEALDGRLKGAETVSLRQKDVVAGQGETAVHVYFPIDSLLSVIVSTGDGFSTEVGSIGNEGMARPEAVLGAPMHAETICQIPGTAYRVPAAQLRAIWEDNIWVRNTIARYVISLQAQYIQAGACNRLHSVEQRTARWLLTTAEGTASRSLNITHDFLASMLGVNRTTVSLTLAAMEDFGALRRTRHAIEILDIERLQDVSCDCYEAIKGFEKAVLNGA